MGHEAIKGRGAQSGQVSARFGLPAYTADGDWRDERALVDGEPPKLRTTVTQEHARSIISFNNSPDIWFDRSLNAYRGCEHGCVYCYARPSHAHLDLSPGLDFETQLFAKPNAAQLLRATFAKRGYQARPLAMGTNTDPYQPIEARYQLTRQVLEICLETRHPVTITTKSDRVLRDIDLLEEMARHDLVAVSISVTSLDPRLSALLEPRAASPAKRLGALGKLSARNIPTHCSVAPIIPAITDHEIEAIIAQASHHNVSAASWIALRLPHEVAPLFREWLDTHFPDRADRVINMVRSMRQGRENDPAFFTRMQPKGVWADLVRERFRIACRKAGIGRGKFHLNCNAFNPSHVTGQLQLL